MRLVRFESDQSEQSFKLNHQLYAGLCLLTINFAVEDFVSSNRVMS